ncbi:MAG: D-alanyl-D-alanine carboxypeptidase [Ruminococcaceae bacterium]|nr:D-alanyl-D-alanine carboxypeptidase [Oscillospiraceae bacterium]
MSGTRKVSLVAMIAAFFLLAGCGADAGKNAESLNAEVQIADQAGAAAEEVPLESEPSSERWEEVWPAEDTEEVFPAAAPRAGLYDGRTLSCIYSKNQNERMYPASLTKIVTACTALRYVSTDEVVRVGTELQFVREGSSVCWLQRGHRLTMYDLLTGMLLSSGNDAAYTVAVNTARTVTGNAEMSDQEAVEYFCGLMNDFVEDLGANNSHFVNPDGWDDDAQYTTVWDMAMIASYALKVPEIREITSLQSKEVHFVSGGSITWENTNSLMNPESKYYCPQVAGMKTGSTSLAGKCLISVVQLDGSEYISIVSGCEKEKDRYGSSLELIGLLLNGEVDGIKPAA